MVRFHARYDKTRLQRENMVVGPGSKELIFLVLTTFSGGAWGRVRESVSKTVTQSVRKSVIKLVTILQFAE